MASFTALIKNEYIKIYKKTSTRILLVIFLAVCLCFAPLVKVINIVAIKEFGIEEADDASYYVSMIEEQKRDLEKAAGDEHTDQSVIEAKLEMCDAVDTSNDWQMTAFNTAMTLKNKQDIQKLTMFCKLDDWRGYCSYTAENAPSEGVRWAADYKLSHDIGYGDEFKKQNELIDNICAAMDGSMDMGIGGSGLSDTELTAIYKYQLENEIYDNTSTKGGSLLNINPTEKMSFWDVLLKTPFVVTLIGIVMVVLAGSTVAGEFSQGTIKFLLINPVKRGKILTAKYVTVMSMGFLMILLLMLINIPMIGIFFGFGDISAPYLALKDGEVIKQSSFLYLIKLYLLSSVEIIVTTTLSFMISSLLRSTALAIVAGFVVRSIGPTLISIMSLLKMDWGRYFIFANTDLLTISNGESQFPQHTVGFALGVVAVHLVVFLLTAWDGFTRRSV